jgi:sporulation protein YlmC with PRC-barrel domain
MRLSELLRREMVTESGERLGRIHDVRGEIVGGRLRVTGLVAGGLGLLERYGIGVAADPDLGRPKAHGHQVIAWARVVRVADEVVIRDE